MSSWGIAEESVTAEDKDFKILLAKIKNRLPEVLFINFTNPNQIGLVLKQAQEVDLTTKIMSASEAGEDEAIINIAGQLAEGLIYAKAGNPPQTPRFIELTTRYKKGAPIYYPHT